MHHSSHSEKEQCIKKTVVLFYLLGLSLLIGCSAEVGSEKWCAHLEAQPKGDWTVNEAGDFARHCIFK